MAFNALLVLTSITRTLILPYCLVFDWVRSRWSTMVVSVFTKSLTSYVRRAVCTYYPVFLLHKASEASTSNPVSVVCELWVLFLPIRAVLQFAFACFGWWSVVSGGDSDSKLTWQWLNILLFLFLWNNIVEVEVLLPLSVPKQFTPLKLFTATADVLWTLNGM